ncbi:MAG TPA: hypothetical protein VIG05_03445 [Candidatus Nitrosotenuis sp.]|jgi:tRNA uridine 5-carbamoylmethylation protein Kti12
MTPLEQRFHQLKADVMELKVQSEVSEIAYNKIKEFASVLGGLDVNNSKGEKAYLEGIRKYLDTELDYLRDKSSIVRKVSPKTADKLEKMINDYDKGTRHIIETVFSKEKLDSEKSGLAALAEIVEFTKTIYSVFELRGIVNMVCDSFLDTIDYLDGNKTNLNDS